MCIASIEKKSKSFGKHIKPLILVNCAYIAHYFTTSKAQMSLKKAFLLLLFFFLLTGNHSKVNKKCSQWNKKYSWDRIMVLKCQVWLFMAFSRGHMQIQINLVLFDCLLNIQTFVKLALKIKRYVHCVTIKNIYLTPYVCNERFFDRRPFMNNKIF